MATIHLTPKERDKIVGALLNMGDDAVKIVTIDGIKLKLIVK